MWYGHWWGWAIARRKRPRRRRRRSRGCPMERPIRCCERLCARFRRGEEGTARSQMARKKHEESSTWRPSGTAEVLDPSPSLDERELDRALRPRSFAEYIGQRAVTDRLKVMVAAARK